MAGLVVPITAADRAQRPSLPAPDEPWALMAAAQMHTEGRLVTPPAPEPTADDRRD